MNLFLSDFLISTSGKNSADALRKCFAEASKYAQTVITIEPGEYLVDTIKPILLCSNISVHAEGAVFYFPKDLGVETNRKMFLGIDCHNITWSGGHFVGYVFEPDSDANTWEPSAFTGCIYIYSTEDGITKDIHIRNVTAENVAGTVVHVHGTDTQFAENIDIKDCQFIKCGKFMWDYGYLWQHAVFNDNPKKTELAFKYLPKEHISSPLKLLGGRIYADYMPAALPEERDAITFFGSKMPDGIQRGRQYFVLNKGAENSLIISDTDGGKPVNLSAIPPETKLFRNMFYIFHDLYTPIALPEKGGGGKGSLETVKCENVIVSGCRISAGGDTMHISESHNVVFSNNQILGSRMGAFFIGFFCKNVTVTGNTVYGTNGSRTMSVEAGTEEITIVGNTFIGGGRGSWFNMPKNAIISNNIFIRNTKKCTPDICIGRFCHVTGDFEQYPELYFTSGTDGEEYGPIIISGNILETEANASAAVAFNSGGHDIILESNILKGDARDIHVAKNCEMPRFSNNIGLGDVIEHTFVNTANSR